MAKNWTLKEAVVVINEGKNKEAIQELAKRFPLASMAIAKMGTNAGIELLFGSMPEHMTMLKMERSLKDGVDGEADEDVADEVTESAADEVDGDVNLEAMTTKQLYNMCIKKGLKVSKYGKPKSYYIEQLTGASDEVGEEADDEDDEEAAKASVLAYDDMNAIELFKLCKKRGIAVEPKKPAKNYIALLKKADEEAAKAQDVEEEDWGDDEEEEKPTKKPSKPSTKKETKKPAKKAAADDDNDDEDWDI